MFYFCQFSKSPEVLAEKIRVYLYIFSQEVGKEQNTTVKNERNTVSFVHAVRPGLIRRQDKEMNNLGLVNARPILYFKLGLASSQKKRKTSNFVIYVQPITRGSSFYLVWKTKSNNAV